jgi:hypothetical protein
MRIECANPDCVNTVHPIKLKLGVVQPGKRWNGLWFCSHKCYFEVRADQFIANKRDGLKKTVRRVKLGLLLLKQNLIDKETLSMALEEQGNSAKKLGEILVGTGKLTHRNLKSVLSMQAGVAPVSLDPALSAKLKDEIPFKLIREFHFICFKYDAVEKIIAVALYDIELLHCIEEIFNEMYPGFLIKLYLDDKEKILSILSNNFPTETFSYLPSTFSPVRMDSKVEKLVYKVVDFLNSNFAGEITIDQHQGAGSVRVSSKIDDVDIYIDISLENKDIGMPEL